MSHSLTAWIALTPANILRGALVLLGIAAWCGGYVWALVRAADASRERKEAMVPVDREREQ